MAVIRVEKTQNYTVMSNHHLRNKNLSLKAKGLMSLMLSLPPDWDYSVGGLVAVCKEAHTSIRSALKELEENDYLIRKRTNSEKGYFVYEYTLYEIPEMRHTENTYAVKAHTENGTQLNKEKINTKELNKENNIYIESYAPLLEHIRDKELRSLYLDYVEMRKNIEAPISERGLKMLINRAERLSNMDYELQKALVEAAIINEWKNVYLPNEQDIQNNTTLAKLRRTYS
jgi:hypothetical protein